VIKGTSKLTYTW